MTMENEFERIMDRILNLTLEEAIEAMIPSEEYWHNRDIIGVALTKQEINILIDWREKITDERRLNEDELKLSKKLVEKLNKLETEG